MGNFENEISFRSFVKNEYKLDAGQRIIEVAGKLFTQCGIKSVTVDDIATNLGMSKKTIYKYYRKKDEIVHKLFKNKISEHKEKFEKIINSHTNVIIEILAMMKEMRNVLSAMNPGIFYDLQKFYPDTWEEFREFKRRFMFNCIVNALEKGKEQGVIRKSIKIDILARMRIEEIEMGFNAQVFPPDRFNVAEVQVTLLENFLYGIATAKGREIIEDANQKID